jgi:dihydrofolate reductase
MRKLIESTLVSLDGFIGSPDRWSPFDEESRPLAKEELENYDALVLGRVTYEFFRANWGSPTGDPYTDQINSIPKYVASRTLSEVTWNVRPPRTGHRRRHRAAQGPAWEGPVQDGHRPR